MTLETANKTAASLSSTHGRSQPLLSSVAFASSYSHLADTRENPIVVPKNMKRNHPSEPEETEGGMKRTKGIKKERGPYISVPSTIVFS